MNELIERLAREAGFGTDDPGRIRASVMPGTDITADLERFAALVAQECVLALDRAQRPMAYDNVLNAAFPMPQEST